MDEVYPRLVSGTEPGLVPPSECTTVTGEVFVVPEGWYHATVNMAETVAVSLQYYLVLSAEQRHEQSAMCTALLVEPKEPLEDAIESHACLFEASIRVIIWV
jgi:hypothetical protein